jgi:methionyl-tRNA formyltransferase
MTADSAPGRAADPARTVFFGSGSFAVPVLEALAAHPQVQLVAVVTAPDRPAGRAKTHTPTPIAVFARELGVPLLQPVRVRALEAVAEIAALEPDLGVLADFGRIIPPALLDLLRLGILGVHPSLLPRHRGATPIQATIAAGDATAGVTIYRMDEGVDTGPIIAARQWPLHGSETGPELEADAARRSAELLKSTLSAVLDGTAQPVAQPVIDELPTRPLRREDARLDPERSATELERLVRAYAGWPGAFVETPDGRILVTRASTAAAQPADAPGRLVRHDGRVAMTTIDGRLVLEGVQPAGGRPMTGDAFLRGRASVIGSTVLAAVAGDR